MYVCTLLKGRRQRASVELVLVAYWALYASFGPIMTLKHLLHGLNFFKSELCVSVGHLSVLCSFSPYLEM